MTPDDPNQTPPPRSRRAVLRRVAIVALVAAGVWCGVVLLVQRSMIYPRHMTATVDVPPMDTIERIWLDIPEGRVEAWFLPARGASAESPAPAVIFAHGNAETIADWPGMLQNYRRLGISVLLPEYRGYGRSDGSPSERGIVGDFVRFYDLLVDRPDVDPDRIIFHGRSLGGGVVAGLARQREPAAMILQSSFTSLTSLAARLLVPPFLMLDRYDTLGVVRTMDRPVLIFHCVHDHVIPYTHAERLHDAAPDSRLVSYNAAHNDCPPDWIALWADVAKFLRDQGLIDTP